MENETPHAKRQKRPAPTKWKQNATKEKRLKGEAYQNKKGKEIKGKSMGPPCNSQFCRISGHRNCQSLTQDNRKLIFDKFWSLNSWEERRLYIRALVMKVIQTIILKVLLSKSDRILQNDT